MARSKPKKIEIAKSMAANEVATTANSSSETCSSLLLDASYAPAMPRRLGIDNANKSCHTGQPFDKRPREIPAISPMPTAEQKLRSSRSGIRTTCSPGA